MRCDFKKTRGGWLRNFPVRRCATRVAIVVCGLWAVVLVNLNSSAINSTLPATRRIKVIQSQLNGDKFDPRLFKEASRAELEKMVVSLLERVKDIESQAKPHVQTEPETAKPPEVKVPTQPATQHPVPNKEVDSDLCGVEKEALLSFPDCRNKISWMTQMWQSDPCYAQFGVNGSVCSFIIYLSEMETFCPRLPSRAQSGASLKKDIAKPQARLRTELDGLIKLLSTSENLLWPKGRVYNMSHLWISAAKRLERENSHILQNRPKLKVIVHMGLLSKQSHWKIGESAFKGGPLGELVQWSDLLSSLYLLGHEIIVSTEVEEITQLVQKMKVLRSSCQVSTDLDVDLIYTDILGVKQLKTRAGAGKAWFKFECRLRVLDSFGTEPSFNEPSFARRNRLNAKSWGMLSLWPKQFYTMFPHSPDNSFLGFTSELPETQLNRSHDYSRLNKKNQSLVYGKNSFMWKGHDAYINTIHRHLEVHGTVAADAPNTRDRAKLPQFVVNHGLLSANQLQLQLKRSRVFVGLGFPYEGPAPLEAIAQGCVFLNPRFDPALSAANNNFFRGKPTLRALTSQHPYAEEFIGAPHVFTVNTKNQREVDEVLKTILSKPPPKPYLPVEFSAYGMLQRVALLLNTQQFCEASIPRPYPRDESLVRVVLASAGDSCKTYCAKQGLMCEPTHFHRINTAEAMKQLGAICTRQESLSVLVAPGFKAKTSTCLLQQTPKLMSCVGSEGGVQRLCPCRDFVVGQVAACKKCL